MTDALYRWGAVVLFSGLVSTSFVMYGFTFNRVGPPPAIGGGDPAAVAIYGIRVLLDPFFLAGMVLALGGALTRMALFQQVGIAETALVSELTLVASVLLAVAVFGSTLRQLDVAGMFLITAGVYLVQMGGG